MPKGCNVYAVRTKALDTVCAINENRRYGDSGPLFDRPDIFSVRKIGPDDDYRCDSIRHITPNEQRDNELLTRTSSISATANQI